MEPQKVKEKEEIQKLRETNSKQLNEIFSLQEKLEEALIKNMNYSKELSDNSNKIHELEQKVKELEEKNKAYNEFKELCQNQNPEEILREFKIKSEGNHQLFSDYENMRMELKRLKYEKENYEKLYKDLLSNNFNHKENNDEDKKELDKYKNRLNDLEDEIELNKNYREENQILHNMLFQIYNLLFEAFRLDKNIKINKKYNYIRKEDFTPNIFSSAFFLLIL